MRFQERLSLMLFSGFLLAWPAAFGADDTASKPPVKEPSQEAATDDDVIANLNLLADFDLLDNMELLNDFDIDNFDIIEFLEGDLASGGGK